MSSGRSIKIIVLTLGNGINILVNILLLPFLVRTLSYHDYGTYGQIQIVLSLIQLIFTFSLNLVVNILLTKAERPKDTLYTISVLSIILSVCGTVILFATSGLISDSFGNADLSYLLNISFFQLTGQILFTIFFQASIYFNQVKKATAITVVFNLIRLGGLFLAIKNYNNLESIVWVLNIITMMQAIAIYLTIPPQYRGRGRFEYASINDIIKLGGPMMLTSIVDRSAVFIDGFLISSMLSTTEYAIYRAGAFEVPFVSSLYASVMTILIPEVTRHIHKGEFEDVVHLKNKAIHSTALLVYPVLVFILFFAKPLMEIYLTDKYAESSIIFTIFSLSLLVRINDYQDILIAKGKSYRILTISGIMMFINIIMNFIMIRKWGIIGGAIAYMIWLIGYASILAYASSISIDKKLSDFFNTKKLLAILFISCILCTILFYFYSIYKQRHFSVIAGVIYFPLIYTILYKMRIVDNELVDSLLSKYKSKKMKLPPR